MPVDPVALKLAQRMEDHQWDFIGVQWEVFERWFAEVWKAGQHMALVGPTGEGKSTFAVRVLANRKWVLALDAKGEDPTLAASGFERVFKWPLSSERLDAIAQGIAQRLIVGGSTRTNDDLARLINLMRDTVNGVREQGGWTLYCDEFQILSDRRMFNLAKEIEILLIAARADGVSVLTSYQASAWISKATTRQASWVGIWPTRDEDMVKAIARTMGRNWKQMVAIVRELPPFHGLIIPKSVHAPMVITSPPKL